MLRRGIIIGILVLVSWYANAQPAGYGYGKQIKIDASEVSGSSVLTDFPVMIRFQGSTASTDLETTANGGRVENTLGYDIIFTSDEAGTTVLDHQIEFYDGAAGEYVAWVNIPSLSNSTDTDIYMYYGNCSANSDLSTTDVWNSDYDAVYFLHDDVLDYTSNNRGGTNSGSSDDSPAIIGDGQSFGVNDYVEIPSTSVSSGQGTVSIWAYTTSFTGTEQYMYGHTSNPNDWVNRIQLYTDDGAGGLDLGLGNNHGLQQGIFTLSTDTWHYIALTWDDGGGGAGTGTCIVYVDGIQRHTETYGGFSTLEAYLDIGNDGRSTVRNEGWDGDLDHARLSNEVFSADWIATEYNNQMEGSTFYSVTDVAPRTYYSFATGNWDANTTWSITSDGTSGAVGTDIWPSRNDNVVIQNGHTVTINATDDNNACGISR